MRPGPTRRVPLSTVSQLVIGFVICNFLLHFRQSPSSTSTPKGQQRQQQQQQQQQQGTTLRRPPPSCVEQLQPGRDGTCIFHSQNAKTCRQDQFVFQLLGGTIDKTSCGMISKQNSPDLCLHKSEFSQEMMKCNCTAPKDPKVFGDTNKFFEIGAADGLYLSNTAFFEYQMGWTGACIEASPLSFAKLKSNRPNCHSYNAVVGRDFVGKNSTFLTIKKYGSWEIGMSGMLGGKGILRTVESARQYAEKVGGTLQVDEVPGVLLSDIWTDAGITEKIDYASVDVEGHEVSVLETWGNDIKVGILDSELHSIEGVIEGWNLTKIPGPSIDVWYIHNDLRNAHSERDIQ